MRRRGSGILMHVTSLPSEFGIGDLGPGACRFVDFLAETRQSVWQILPLGPTSPAIGSSPYSSFSAFAGNPLLLSPAALVSEGFLGPADISQHLTFSPFRVDYESVERFKNQVLARAFERRREHLADDPDFVRFCRENAHWLDDYALFAAIKASFGGRVWSDWPAELKNREPAALADIAGRLSGEVLAHKFVQHLFFRQWSALKRYAGEHRVHLIGDAPIYVTYDSADVWANPHLFKLDGAKQPAFVAGVPPDYFSATGQLWGNPVFNWDVIKREKFDWWLRRIGHNFSLYDMVRIDHFRGFAGYWEIPAGEKTAVGGSWVDAPGLEFFDAVAAAFPSLPIIAEDLGVITPDVRELRDAFGFPGMRILQFSFGPGIGENHDALHNHVRNCLAYTGTHDNNTTRGWFKEETTSDDRKRLFAYLGYEVDESHVSWALIRLAMASVARLAIFPMQDLLALDSGARMNTPAVADGNWAWRLPPEALTDDLKAKLRGLTTLFGRG